MLDVLRQQGRSQAHRPIDCGRLPALHEFDLISGMTGVGVHLLRRHGDSQLLRDVLAYLVRLTEPVNVAGVQLARHTIASNSPPASDWDACLLLDG